MIPYFELSKEFVGEDVEHLVSFERPDSVCAFFSVLGYYFAVEFVKLNEVWPLKDEICEQLDALLLAFLEFPSMI